MESSLASFFPIVVTRAAAGASVALSLLPLSFLAFLTGSASEVLHSSTEALGANTLLSVAVSARHGSSMSVHGTGSMAFLAATIELNGRNIDVVLVLPLRHLLMASLSPSLLLVEGVLLPLLPVHLSASLIETLTPLIEALTPLVKTLTSLVEALALLSPLPSPLIEASLTSSLVPHKQNDKIDSMRLQISPYSTTIHSLKYLCYQSKGNIRISCRTAHIIRHLSPEQQPWLDLLYGTGFLLSLSLPLGGT